MNITTEYLVSTGSTHRLSDALGSAVRDQLTDTQGAVTLAKSYQPYGETLASAGNGTSPFAFTGEQTDVSGLTYLRARYYSSGTGRFLTRDTWMGEYNRPLSLNRWNYVQANPINFMDSTGYYPTKPMRCGDSTWSRVNVAETYVSNKDSNGNTIMDEMNTYTAAGIGVQCYGTDLKDPRKIKDWANSGEGPAQITDNERMTAYGVRIGTREIPRGWGLLCWINKKAGLDAGCLCNTRDEM